MKKHKYLKKFYKHTKFPHQWHLSKKQKRKMKKIQKCCGLDIRECWDCELSFHAWLYEHICAYEKYTMCDLQYGIYEFHGKNRTLGEMIKKLKKRLSIYFKTLSDASIDKKQQKKIDEIDEIWHIIKHACWW